MNQYVYWHAPLWEVLLIGLLSLVIVVSLVWSAWCRSNLSANKTIVLEPLFLFNPVSGVISLNNAAKELLESLPILEIPSSILTKTLNEAFFEGCITQEKGWPQKDKSLMAWPIFAQSDEVKEVLALVIREVPQIAPPSEAALQVPSSCEEPWLVLGETLRLHSTRPLLQVSCPNGTTEPSETWHENQLSHLEEGLLRYLWKHLAEVQASEVLFAALWPDEKVSDFGLRPDQKDRLRRLVYQVRQRLEPEPSHPRYLCTAHGVGYVLYKKSENLP